MGNNSTKITLICKPIKLNDLQKLYGHAELKETYNLHEYLDEIPDYTNYIIENSLVVDYCKNKCYDDNEHLKYVKKVYKVAKTFTISHTKLNNHIKLLCDKDIQDKPKLIFNNEIGIKLNEIIAQHLL